MNSGLQCLSNTMDLTKYFLYNCHKEDINKDNPLGMSGKLAKAYANLLQELWRGKDGRTAPWDLKKTLGSRISRFSGFGQQDSAELVNYLLDLMHEDLNRVKKKPYVELSEELNRPDEIVAKEFWDAHLARNQSIIVDLMHGQHKSTVTCLTCKKIATTFDAYLSVVVPLTKSGDTELEWNFVPYDMHIYNEKEEEWQQREMPVLKCMMKTGTTIFDAKTLLIQKLKLDGVAPEDLVFCDQSKG